MMILIGFHEYCGLFSELNGDVMDLKGIRGELTIKQEGSDQEIMALKTDMSN